MAYQNEEIKSEICQIKKSISAHPENIKGMKEEITQIKQEDEELKQKLMSTNRILKRNNVLMFGRSEGKYKIIRYHIVWTLN